MYKKIRFFIIMFFICNLFLLNSGCIKLTGNITDINKQSSQSSEDGWVLVNDEDNSNPNPPKDETEKIQNITNQTNKTGTPSTAKTDTQPTANPSSPSDQSKESLPDLVITRVGFNPPAPYYSGTPLKFGVEIANIGNSEATNFKIDAYLDGTLFDTGIYKKLSQSETIQLWTEYIWYAVPGNHKIVWIVDSTNNVKELSENNNIMQINFSVSN